MKLAGVQKALFSRNTLAAVAGFLLAISFPKTGIAGLAWIAPGLILLAALGATGKRTFRLGYLAGVVHYVTSLYWLLFIPFPMGAVAGWLALSAYLALYPASWVWLCWQMFPRRIRTDDSLASRHAVPGSLLPPLISLKALTEQFLFTPWIQRALWAVACALIWVALEMVVARFLTGFPWNLLGVSQYRILAVIQIASITGVYGVSFLVVWFSVSLAGACLAIVARPAAARTWLSDLVFPFLGVAMVCAFGVGRMAELPAATDPAIKTALIQPSIPQTLIWDPKENTNRFKQLLRLTERALAEKPDLVVWPEAAVPDLLRYEPDTWQAVQKLVLDHRVWMIVGADDAVPRTESVATREFDFYNSSFLINPEGRIVAAYRKRKLVMFGEYVPLVRWLPFLKYLAPIGEGFKSGDRVSPFSMPELKTKTSVLICFEDTFPHLLREYAEADTDFLLNLTNNGWFGESAAQWQHAANAVFRAVENGLPLVRCANNGLSCWVDSLGGLHDIFFGNSKDIYGAGFKIVKIPLLGNKGKRAPTFYNQHGDWFGWGCTALAAGLLAFGAFASRTSPGREDLNT